jgi:hypothetical protein
MGSGRLWQRWVLGCAAAETIGMAAAATAARLGQDAAGGGGTRDRWAALAIVVGGGLVEGLALGVLQSRVLARWWPAVRRTRFVLLTVAVAGLGWAAASAPSVLAGEDDGASGPPLGLVVLGALGIGLVMGPVLGAAQAVALRGAVVHHRRWVTANLVAWPPAMAVIFLGASTAGAEWPTVDVSGYGAATGLLAGATLGLVSGGWLDSLDGQSVGNRVALVLVARRRLHADRRLVGLAVAGRRTGQVVRFPVQYAAHERGLVVVPGRPGRKTWWRNIEPEDTDVWVLDGCGWHVAQARLLLPADGGHDAALTAYRARWPRFEPAVVQPVVVLRLVGPGIPATSRAFLSVRW